jgi:uncharacterized membrane protein YeaQ/YmgE (transglycosylase-associated protein family)
MHMHFGFLGWIIIGLLAGWVASIVMNRHHGLIVNLIIGLIGALLGGWLAQMFGFVALGYVSEFLIALVGAVVLLFILGLINRPRY